MTFLGLGGGHRGVCLVTNHWVAHFGVYFCDLWGFHVYITLYNKES